MRKKQKEYQGNAFFRTESLLDPRDARGAEAVGGGDDFPWVRAVQFGLDGKECGFCRESPRAHHSRIHQQAGGSQIGFRSDANEVGGDYCDAMISAGNGGDSIAGDTMDAGAGGAGGTVDRLAVYGFQQNNTLTAGMAGDGSKAAAGGSVSALNLSSYGDGGVNNVTAGDGTGGGAGGAIKGVTIYSSDYEANSVSLTAGNGSLSGAGGNVENVSDSSGRWAFSATDESGAPVWMLNPTQLDLNIRAGDGGIGDETHVGGAGGSVKNIDMMPPSDGHLYDIQAGFGGDGLKGGVGGNIETVKIFSKGAASAYNYNIGKQVTVQAILTPGAASGEVSLTAGNGGMSIGTYAGGKGGVVKSVTWNIDDLVRVLVNGTDGDSGIV